jgi:hypothetical protein
MAQEALTARKGDGAARLRPRLAAALAVAVLISAGSPRAASAGGDGTLPVVPPLALKQLGPLRLHDIEFRCYRSLYKMRIAGEPVYAYPTQDGWWRMRRTPAFRACVERSLKELGY